MPRSSPAEYTPASRTPTSPYRRPHRGRTDASYPGAKRIAFGWQPGGEQLPVTLSGAKSICKPTVPACLVSRRNRTPANGARPRQDPETGMNTLAAGPSVPSRNSPLCRLPSVERLLYRDTVKPVSPSSPVISAAEPPNDEKLWALPERSSSVMDEYVGPTRNRRWP